MTVRPLDFAFPAMSPLSRRRPAEIAQDEIVLELEAELARRRDFYPRRVREGKMDAADADRHVAILAQILDELRETPEDPRRRAHELACGFTWEDRVRELRRELAIRRAAFPKRIEQRTMTEDECRQRLERLEAAHWLYWIGGRGWDNRFAAAADPHAPAIRAAVRAFRAERDAWQLTAHDAGDRAIAPIDPATRADMRKYVALYGATETHQEAA